MKIKVLLFTILLFSAIALHAQNSIESYSIQVSFDKTVHIIFPSAIKYVDLGSGDIIAAKAPGAENVLRVKAAVENFCDTTNISVICEDGTFYSFVVRYNSKPKRLNILLRDDNILVEGEHDVSPAVVDKITRAIYKNNQNDIKYLGCKRYAMQMLVKSIFVYKGLFFVHIVIKNNSNIPFDVEYIRFTIQERRLIKRTARQEIQVNTVKAFNEQRTIEENSIARAVYVLPKFTISSDKIFIVQLIEKGGARNLTIQIESEDFYNAKTVENLKLR